MAHRIKPEDTGTCSISAFASFFAWLIETRREMSTAQSIIEDTHYRL